MVKFMRKRKIRNKTRAPIENEQPKLVMDIIEEEYPDRYEMLKEKISQLGRMFTQDEWLSILTRSRAEHERFLPNRQDQKRAD